MNTLFQTNPSKTLLLAAGAALLMHSGMAAAADNDVLEQRIATLEQQLQHQDADPASGPSVKLFGYTQFGATVGSANTRPPFAFDRVRLGVQGVINERIGYRMMVEMLKLDKPAKANTTVEGLLDALLTCKLAPALKLTAGQFKTPFSMAYNTSASKLDVIGFGMATNVSLDRGVGLMASGRNVAASGIGYDIGLFNAGTRADATAYSAGRLGRDDMVVGRLLFDGLGNALHLEAGAAHAGVKNGSPYTAGYAAMRLHLKPVELKSEWLQGKQGTRKTVVVYGQLLATVLQHYEMVGKWERSRLTDTATQLTADNLIIGINAALYADKPQRARLQLNYVIAGRDAKSLGTPVGFRKGYVDNQVKLLLQAGF